MAGVMGAMWLWERRTSRVREQQIDEAHVRIMADRILIDELLDVVRQNTEAITHLSHVVNIQVAQTSEHPFGPLIVKITASS